MIEIRPAQVPDLPELRRVAIRTQVETFSKSNSHDIMEAYLRETFNEETFTREFHELGSVYLIAWEGTAMAGYLRLRLNGEVGHLLGNNAIELQRLYVTQEYQGRKVGATLMQQACAYSRQRQFEWLWLGVWDGNMKAQAFYKRWGFEPFSEHTFWMGPDPQHDWLLKLKL